MQIKFKFLILFALFSTVLLAQKKDDKFSPSKLRTNFENVHKTEGKIFYEQRLYRNPFIGLYEMNRITGDTSNRTFVPLFQNMPIGVFAMGDQVRLSALSKQERKSYLKSASFPFQKKSYKLDLYIQPYFSAIFGNFDRPIQSNTSIGLQTQIFIFPGLSFSTGILFPIIRQMDGSSKGIRPTATFLNQFYAAGNQYVSASAGLFNNDQYGLNVQYRYTDLGKPWSYGFETGLTGIYQYPKGGVYIGKLEEFMLLADVAYRFNSQDVTLKLTGGQFLWNDKGGRIELLRQFTNVEVGVFATKTQNGSTVGFNFAVPIPPGKIAQGKNVRLRTTDEFRWEYSYTRGYRIGERYRLGYQLDQKLRQYHQGYLNGQKHRLDD